MDNAGSCTLIFYRLPADWRSEPILNVIAAIAQNSSFTHVELAIGSAAGQNGEMTNVARVFNDNTGVELVSRTGRNPSYSYVQLGCTSAQERAMLSHGRACVGKPFDNFAMVRSVIYPRTTSGASYFCAELVADILKAGGMLHSSSNPGAATPESLHSMYSKRAAVSANPFLLRDSTFTKNLRGNLAASTLNDLNGTRCGEQARGAERAFLAKEAVEGAKGARNVGNLVVVAARKASAVKDAFSLSLDSLDMRASLKQRAR